MEVELPDGKIKLEEIHQPGLIDLYTISSPFRERSSA